MNEIDLNIAAVHAKYRSGELTPGEVVDYVLTKAEKLRDHAIWITRLSRQEIQPYLDRISHGSPANLPLYGIPFAIKDNFDLAGTPTTAACPAYAYVPSESAFAVQRLLDAGAIPIGKTNMDQFATGLSGTRSPYGVVRNAIDPAYIAGGSSSGSAVAAALGLASFALGTDTAGSGRVPAMFNRLIGVKPSRGIISARGIVPACRSLDCASIFALNPDDAAKIYEILAVHDEQDPYARRAISEQAPGSRRFGIIPPDQLEVFGNEAARALMDAAVENLVQLGFTPVEMEYEPFRQAASLLYEGPWLAERYAAIEPLITTHPELLHPITRAVIEPGGRISAAEAFKAMYRLQDLKKSADAQLAGVDFVLTPTAAPIYTIQEMEHDPLGLTSTLGYYTNFMNLLDYPAVAVPAGSFPNALPFGVTFFSNTFSDRRLLDLSRRFLSTDEMEMGATGFMWKGEKDYQPAARSGGDRLNLLVCGAHMTGLPLNHQLVELGGQYIDTVKTAGCYRLFRLRGGPPYRPGVVRDEDGGAHIEGEIWSLPRTAAGSLLEQIPAPLGLGKILLDSGDQVNGFLCEAYGTEDAEEITHLGSWRNYLNKSAS